MSLQPRNAMSGGGPQPQPQPADDGDDEEEPDIGMGSFMSGDPNFNRETSDSQSMTKALSTLKTYLSNYWEMKRFRPAMLVFLHSLLARKEAKWYKALNFVFFDWLVDDWKSAGLPSKQSKRAAFSVYSTFLNREGALSLEGMARSLNKTLELGQPALDQPIRTLSQLFAKRPMDSHMERIVAGFGDAQASLKSTLEALATSVSAEIQAKRRDGFVSDILPGVDGLRPDLSDERQQRFIDQCRGVMLAHVNYMATTPFGGPLEAGCLASLLERLFRMSPLTELPMELPQFNSPKLRGSGGRTFGGFKDMERRGTHLLRPLELDRIRACSACGKLLCGPGPQAMRCKVGDCQVVSHRACIDLVKPISCSSAAGLITRSHSNEGRDSSAPKAPAKSSGSSAADPASAATGTAAAASAGPPASAVTAGPSQPQHVASMPHIGVEAGGGTVGGHRGSLDAGQEAGAGDARLLSPYDLGGEPLTAAEEDAVSKNPEIGGVPADFQGYIESSDLARRLAKLRPASGSEKDAERFREYQLALHEVIFSSKSHLRALNLLELLFVQPWPQASRQVLHQLGLHFVAECIALYRSLHDCIGGGDSLAEFQSTGRLERFGDRLLGWYSEENNAQNFQRLGISFGFSKVTTRRKTASINEDDIILRLIGLRREDSTFNRFFVRAESHPAMNKRRFVDLYSVNMQQTMRMVTLLETAAKKAKRAKEACEFAEKDAAYLDKCVGWAKAISDYCNTTGAKLKELSRQLVLSKSFSIFWERSLMDETRIIRFKDQVSHLHTCKLHMTREVLMPGLEGYRLRLFVFSDFLLVISESDEPRGVKYQLLKQLGPSVSVDSQQQQQQQPQPQPQLQQQQSQTGQSQSAELANLIETNCPPVIPMDSVVHIFDTATESRRRLPGSRVVDTEFRIIVEQVTARGSGGASRVKPLMLEFRMSQEKPRLSFFANETQRQASDFVECIRGLAPRLSQRQLDRHASLSGSALELTAARAGASILSLPGQQQLLQAPHLQADHRRVHSSAGINVPRPQPAASRRADTDESEGEAAGPGSDSQPSSSPDAAAQLSAGLAIELQSKVEAAVREQQTVLPVAMGIDWRNCPDALAMSQSERQPGQPEKILLAWRLMAEASSALAAVFPALSKSGDGTAAMIDSSLLRLSSLARATADCLDREMRKDQPVEVRSPATASSSDFDSKFRLSRVSEVSGDSQTQAPQELLLTERRSQISASSQPTTPKSPQSTPPGKPEKPEKPVKPENLRKTEDLTKPEKPAKPPKPAPRLQQAPAAPALAPAAQPAAQPAVQLAAQPATQPAAQPAAKPAAQPEAQPAAQLSSGCESSSRSETDSDTGDSSSSEYSEEEDNSEAKADGPAGSLNSEV